MSDKTRKVAFPRDAQEQLRERDEQDGSADDSTHLVVSRETREQLYEFRERGESMDETVERLFESTQDSRPLFSTFGVLATVGALAWLGSFALVGGTVSNIVAGLYIALTLCWAVLRELRFRGYVSG